MWVVIRIGYQCWVLDLELQVTKFIVMSRMIFQVVVIELMRIWDATWDSWFDHYYARGSSGLLTTCQEVNWLFQAFGQTLGFGIG